MPRFILKPDPHRDEYVLWSTVVDGPVTEVLTRTSMADFVTAEGGVTADCDDMLCRADTNGTSSPDAERSWAAAYRVGDEGTLIPHRLVAEYTQRNPPVVGR